MEDPMPEATAAPFATAARPVAIAPDVDASGAHRYPYRRRRPPDHTPLVRLNIALRGLMELGIVLALGVWAHHLGGTPASKLLLTLAAPAAGFGFWGAVDFRWAGRFAEPLRLVQELAVTALAALALLAAGHALWGLALAGLSAGHHGLVYALGQRLLGDRDQT
jgi:hypothetical protein